MNTSKTNEKLGSLSKEIYTQKLYKDEILKNVQVTQRREEK